MYKIFRKIYFYLFLLYFKYKNKKLFSAIIDKINPFLVISCNGGYPAALSCLDLILICKSKMKKSILTIVSTPQPKTLIDFFYKKIPLSVDNVIVNSNIIKNNLVDNRGFIKKNISVVYNSVGSTNFNYWDFYKKPGEILFGYVGRIEKKKGSYVLLEAFSDIVKNENIRLLMIGAGPELDDVKKYSNKLGLEGKIIFTGYLSVNVYDILSVIDIFVFPSLWEGLPYSILEAMNAKKIIISTNVGGIPELIKNNEEGILIPPNNVNELALAMQNVIVNFDKYQYLGINAKKKIEEKFKFDKFRENIIKLISIDK